MGRRNDEEFVAFAAGSQARLRRTAYLMCGDWPLASDIVQEALIRVYVAWPRLEKTGNLGAYARRAVVSVAVDMGRKRSKSEIPTLDDDTVPSRGSDADVAASVSDRQALLAALEQLPARQRACVVLRYYEDLAVNDVAALLGISEGTVKSQTSRALTSLQSIYRTQAGDELFVGEERSTSA